MSARRPLADILVRQIFRAYIGVAVLVTGLQMWGLYLNEQKTALRELNTIAKALEPSVAEALWNFQEPILQSLANGALENELVSAIAITDTANTIRIEAGNIRRDVNAARASVVHPLFSLEAGGPDDSLGAIELHLKRTAVMGRVYRSFASLLLGAIIKAAGLWMIIVYLARRLLTAPLTRFTRSLETTDIAHDNDDANAIPREVSDCLELDALHKAYAELLHRAKANQRLQEEKLAAEARSAEHSRFLASASHDLRQPLHAMTLYLAALSRSDLTAASAALIDKAQSCAQAVDGMFRSILDLSRLEAGVAQPQLRVFALQEMLDAVRVQFEPAARAKGIALRIVPSRLNTRSDPALLARIVHNLVSNAVRYTETGGVVVGCRRAGRLIRIEVHDTGPGIAEATRRVVFADYGRAVPSSSTEGAGLGLSIARRMSALLGHSLALRSRTGHGSSFSLSVPAITTHDAESAEAASPEQHADASGPIAGKLILIVDDELAILDATSALVESWRGIALTASSFDEAVALASTPDFMPDAILCDFQLADERDGNMLLQQLRGIFGRPIPALLITGARLPDDALPLAAHVLYKPVEEANLYNALAALLRRHDHTLHGMTAGLAEIRDYPPSP